MTVDEGCEYFENISNIKTKLLTLKKVGLGYIKIGQQATTLSGGEAQRIKLAKELSKRSTGRTIYILDEPTTGLHQHDIKKLLEILHTFVALGNTVVVSNTILMLSKQLIILWTWDLKVVLKVEKLSQRENLRKFAKLTKVTQANF